MTMPTPDDMVHSLAGLLALFGVAGFIALFNAYKAVQWKRAELAGSYLRDFYSDPEVAFACRSLEWLGGKLIVPDCLRPLLENDQKVVPHNLELFKNAMVRYINYDEFDVEPRLQIYRTAMDTMLTKLSLISNALDNKLFRPSDLRDVGYWVVRMKSVGFLEDFIHEYGYGESTKKLRAYFVESFSVYGGAGLNQDRAAI